jgi:amidase
VPGVDDVDLCYSGAAEQARLVRSGAVSARELVRATLDRIERVDPALNSYRVVLADQALAAAADADQDRAGGQGLPLAGVPVAVKDDQDVAGEVTTWGTGANRTPAEADSPLVAQLRAAGAVIVGKTTCSELVVWPFTETPRWGATRNPWDTDFSPGGSSGGSGAAVAAGLCGLALGSDGLGSIRVPAGFCGVVGLKPQHGRVWHDPLDWHGMAVNGPLGRRVVDAALFLDVAAVDRPSEGFVAALADRRPRRVAVAWKSAAYYPLAARVGEQQRLAVSHIADTLTALGHSVDECEVGFPLATSNSYLARYLSGVAECLATLEDPDAVSGRTRVMARLGRSIPASVVERAVAAQAGVAERVNRVFEAHDVVLTPGAVQAPLRVGELEGQGAIRSLYWSGRKIPHFAPWNAVGQPAVSVPAGFDERGLPVSVQLAGPPGSEAMLLALSTQLEEALEWAEHRPLP